MRRALLPVLAVAAVALASCGGGKGDDTSTAATDSSTTTVDTGPLDKCAGPVDDVKVSGDFGTKQTVTFDAPLKVSDTECKVLITGTGPATQEGDSVVLLFQILNART